MELIPIIIITAGIIAMALLSFKEAWHNRKARKQESTENRKP